MKLSKRDVELLERRISMDKQVMSIAEDDYAMVQVYVDAKDEAMLLTRILNESEKEE